MEDFNDQFPLDPQHSEFMVTPSCTMEDLKKGLDEIRKEIVMLTAMERLYAEMYKKAENEVKELEAQWMMEMPDGE